VWLRGRGVGRDAGGGVLERRVLLLCVEGRRCDAGAAHGAGAACAPGTPAAATIAVHVQLEF